jgi:anaerobic selenocysteine-containing dehydrogenase
MNFADIVLPTATPYESSHPFEARGNWIMARNKVIEPLGDYKSIYEFLLDLAVKMGYGRDFWNGDIEACQNELLSSFDMTVDALREYPIGRFYESAGGSAAMKTMPASFRAKAPGLAKSRICPGQGRAL